MKILLIILALSAGGSQITCAQSNFKPEDTEFYTPVPPLVKTRTTGAPSDAIVLFDGSNLNAWQSSNGADIPVTWDIKEKQLIVKPGSGDIQTKEKFVDFQLHVEWKSPELIKGKGQGRGNSGIFLQGKYEIQVLDNNDNPTYTNGQAGSLYKQRAPLVTALPEASQWHTYDILFTAPRFNKDNILIKKGSVTVLHNGVVIHYNTQIEGTTEYIGMPKIVAENDGPIKLQDHGDLVSFRNIWIRPL